MSDLLKQRLISGGLEFEVREMDGTDISTFAMNPRYAKFNDDQISNMQLIRCVRKIEVGKSTPLEVEGFNKLTFRQIQTIRGVFNQLNMSADPEALIQDAIRTVLDAVDDLSEGTVAELEAKLAAQKPPLVEPPAEG